MEHFRNREIRRAKTADILAHREAPLEIMTVMETWIFT